MRFFADQNVDADVLRELRKLRHEAWSADDAGLGRDLDDDLTVYAQRQHAVLLTHDAEFSRRRRENVIGQHVWLDCDELIAGTVVVRHLDDMIPLLSRYQDLWIRLARTAAMDVVW